jgi:hypothetical protein
MEVEERKNKEKRGVPANDLHTLTSNSGGNLKGTTTFPEISSETILISCWFM